MFIECLHLRSVTVRPWRQRLTSHLHLVTSYLLIFCSLKDLRVGL